METTSTNTNAENLKILEAQQLEEKETRERDDEKIKEDERHRAQKSGGSKPGGGISISLPSGKDEEDKDGKDNEHDEPAEDSVFSCHFGTVGDLAVMGGIEQSGFAAEFAAFDPNSTHITNSHFAGPFADSMIAEQANNNTPAMDMNAPIPVEIPSMPPPA